MSSSLTSSCNPIIDRSAVLPVSITRNSSDFDIVANLGLLKRRARDRDTISDKESLYYQFRVDRVTKVRLTLENRLEKDPVAGFGQGISRSEFTWGLYRFRGSQSF
ncbi:hypothetical protein [Leptolyngbya ohadii]|uniref:hypothetical protein n=1 Tax=Leptolyngbya ohadii TaxID=1962290 RepID=UPI000B59E1DF|nr:hypothetical protein [Leptolyngbya ohadii]